MSSNPADRDLTGADAVILAEIRESTLSVLREAIGHGTTVAIVDAPNQRNVGDSMIWQGELAYLRALESSIAYVADMACYRAADLRASLPPGGTVLVHGGGNFGDIWKGHQRFRERIARELKDYRVIQLPQSIWFTDAAQAANANRILSSHPDFTVMVRDRESEQRLREQLPDLKGTYCWDMALGWDPPTLTNRKANRFPLVLARLDREGVSQLNGPAISAALGTDVDVADWTKAELDSWRWRVARWLPNLVARQPRLMGSRFIRSVLSASIRSINSANVRAGVRLFSGRPVVVADRLHAHVLALLMGIDHVILDNSYGKLGAVFRGYTGRFSTARYASSVDEAVDILRQTRPNR